MSDKREILLIRFGALGDLVFCEPHFRIMREAFKEHKLTLLTRNFGKELYEKTGYFDEILVYKSILDIFTKIKKRKFYIVINMQGNRASHVVSFFAKKDILVNSATTLVQRFLGIKKVRAKSIEELLVASKVSKEIIEETLSKPNVYKIMFPHKKEQRDSSKKIVAISTGSSKRWESKRWGVLNYKELIEKLIEEDFDIVLVGSSLENEDANIIVKDSGNNLINMVGKTKIYELLNILANVDLYIGNDSGPVHMAAAVGTDTITIFTSTSKSHCVKNMNYLGEHVCFSPIGVDCHPCYKSKCPKKLNEYMKCAKSIKVADILNEALRKIEAK